MARMLPIIYVRGFGGGPSGIDALVEDPFYGFNVGSTHVRVGARGEPSFYQFESGQHPLGSHPRSSGAARRKG